MMLDHFRRSASTPVEPVRLTNAARLSAALAGASATAGQSATVMAEQAKLAAEQARLAAIQARYWASPHVTSAVGWASPHVTSARDWASPRVESAWRRSQEAASPTVERVAGKAVPVVDTAYERLVQDLLPKVVASVTAAAAATAAGADKAHDATSARLRDLAHLEPPKKSNTGAKVFWILTGLAAGGAAIAAWQRKGPSTDPWAEQPWEPLDDDPDATTTASLATSGDGLSDGVDTGSSDEGGVHVSAEPGEATPADLDPAHSGETAAGGALGSTEGDPLGTGDGEGSPEQR